MSNPVADLLLRVEQLTTADLIASRDEGLTAGRAAAEGVAAGTLRRVDFIAQCVLATRRPHVHGEEAYALGFFAGVHALLLRVPARRG